MRHFPSQHSTFVGLIYSLFYSILLVLGSNVDEKCGFGYELLATRLETLDYEIAKNVVTTKLQINAIMATIQELTGATVALSALNPGMTQKLVTAPITCKDATIKSSGVHLIQPERGFQKPFLVSCDQEYEGGGWTVIQHRFNGSVSFVRPWEEFKNGFGHLNGEFWLGLEKVHQLTYGTPHELHILLEDFDGKQVVAKYSEFAIGSESESFELSKLGTYNGTAGDSLGHHKSHRFTTFDRDNDRNDGTNCAQAYSGAWWHVNCHASNLNGLYLKGATETYANGMCWSNFRGYNYSLKVSKMMIRSIL